jgi:GAF domain-containing protein
MNVTQSQQGPCDLEDVIATELLDRRPPRETDPEAETRMLLELARDLAKNPDNFFQKLVEAALELSNADSTGLSLLDEETNTFLWPAVAGELKSYIGSGTPGDFGLCNIVMDRQSAVLFLHPERHFSYLAAITSPLEEVLLTPFFMDHKAVGTIWAVIHDPNRKFDSEDRRLLNSLSTFAASAYRIYTNNGTLQTLLKKKMSV